MKLSSTASGLDRRSMRRVNLVKIRDAKNSLLVGDELSYHQRMGRQSVCSKDEGVHRSAEETCSVGLSPIAIP